MGLTRLSAVCLVGLVWVLSFCICIPSILSVDYDICQMKGDNSPSTHLINSLMAFYLPLVIIVACYSVVFWNLKQKFDKKVIAKMERLETLSRQTSKAGQTGTQQVRSLLFSILEWFP